MSKKHEALVGKGIRIERHGRFIHFDTRRKFTAEEKIRIVLKAFAEIHPSGIFAAGKVSSRALTMPG